MFVKRNAVPPKHQDLIMCVENCIPLEHKAHIEQGNTREALGRCARAMFKRIGAATIGTWYVSLWQEHGLSVNQGMLIEPKHMKVRRLVPLIEAGAEIDGVSLPPTGWELESEKGQTDIRAQLALRMQRKRRKWKTSIPEEHNGYYTDQLFEWMDEGYWVSYLTKTLGIQWPC